MKDVTQDQRWAQWMAQAQRFADSEQFHDAARRARMLHDEVSRALEATADGGRRAHLEQELERIATMQTDIEARRADWQARAAQLRDERAAHAEDEMKRPLPEGLPGRTRA